MTGSRALRTAAAGTLLLPAAMKLWFADASDPAVLAIAMLEVGAGCVIAWGNAHWCRLGCYVGMIIPVAGSSLRAMSNTDGCSCVGDLGGSESVVRAVLGWAMLLSSATCLVCVAPRLRSGSEKRTV